MMSEFEDPALAGLIGHLAPLIGTAVTLGVSAALLMVTRVWALRGIEA